MVALGTFVSLRVCGLRGGGRGGHDGRGRGKQGEAEASLIFTMTFCFFPSVQQGSKWRLKHPC